jgi:hypothetical protein
MLSALKDRFLAARFYGLLARRSAPVMLASNVRQYQ